MKKLIIFIFCLFGFMLTSSADTLSVKDIVNSVNNQNYNYELFLEENNNKIHVQKSGENLYEFDYTDEYISYQTTELNSDISVYVADILKAILKLSGYADVDFVDDNVVNDYDKYGFYIETTTEGVDNYITNFKISLDTEKIDKLVSEFAKPKDENISVNENKDNPTTGVSLSVITTIILLVGSIIIFSYYKNNNVFKKF